jgi:4-amino-4-deoxychorismate lyase
MSLLLESIKLLDGNFKNLFYHEQRMNRSLKTLCGTEDYFNLEEFLSKIDRPDVGLHKCRIVYDEAVREVEFMPYRPRLIDSLKIVENDNISYEFKYADRDEIDALFARREQCDDILIVKNGLITDTSYANILLKKGKQWFTPWSALLKGTMRTKLVEYSKVQEEEIPVTEISNFKSFKLINAMMEFDAPEVDISKIVL